MLNKKFLTSFIALSFVFSPIGILACDEQGKTGFMPENNLYIGVDDKDANKSIDETAFNRVIDRAEKIYAPMIRKKGGILKVNRLWSDGTVNASAMRKLIIWEVNMYGGLARHSLITEDGFALVLCHELGHHLGGAPKVSSMLMTWASNEGQSDYYSSAKCFRLIYGQDDNIGIVSRMAIPTEVKDKCDQVYANASESALCQRMSMAGLSLAQLLAALGSSGKVDFTTPDRSTVAKTYDGHPKAQCRLDTYFQGSLCDRPANEEPGKTDHNLGYCTAKNGHDIGLRPLCWYKLAE